MTPTVAIAFLLVYVLGAFAYGSALTLSLRQAGPVWSSYRHRAVAGATRLDGASLTLFAWSALWFVVLALDQFSEIASGDTRRGWLDVAQLLLVLGFPPLIMHTMFQEARCGEWSGRSRVWAARVLVAVYVAAPLAAMWFLALVFDLVTVANASTWIGGVIAALFAVAGIYSPIVLNRHPRPRAAADQNNLRSVLNGLFVVLTLMNLLPALTSGSVISFEMLGRLMSVTPLLFLSATTYYENRFQFYDLLVKRGAMLLATLGALGVFFMAALPWLDGLPRDAARPWLYALALVPLMLAAPGLAGDLSRRLDRAWFGRHYTPVSAVTTVLASIQAATDEPSLLAAAEASLREVLGVTVRLSTSQPENASARVAFRIDGTPADPSVWLTVPVTPGERSLLSEDLTLLRSLGTVITYLVENLRLQQRRQEQDLLAQELRVQTSQSELKALRAQINPHFLFNALNTVASLIHTDPQRADRAVEQLSEVFRHTLRRSENEWAALDQELAFAASYLDVEEARFGARLRYTIDADAVARRAPVPSMLVHTLIENAVKHGIAQVRGHGTLDVTARAVGGRLTIAVTDNGPGPEGDPGLPAGSRRAGEQFGLRSVRHRLRGHFGDAAAFTLTRDVGRGLTVAAIDMPIVAVETRPQPTRPVPA